MTRCNSMHNVWSATPTQPKQFAGQYLRSSQLMFILLDLVKTAIPQQAIRQGKVSGVQALLFNHDAEGAPEHTQLE